MNLGIQKKKYMTDQDIEKGFDVWWLLFQTRRALKKAREKELSKYGLTVAQAQILYVLNYISYEATPAELSRWLLLEPHSISHILMTMQKKGLLKKIKDTNRKNLVRIIVTEKGLETWYQIQGRESIQRMLSCLSNDDRQQIRALLEKLFTKALEELGVDRRLPFPQF